MTPATVRSRVEEIAEKGETLVTLTPTQAARLQAVDFCRVSPTADPFTWRISDVARVGVVAIDDVRFFVRPKTPLRSLLFMASYAGAQAHVSDSAHSFEAELDVPATLAAALIRAVGEATRRTLLKGYVTVEESGTVIRGRWDIARQLKIRPGLPVPVELTFDDYTEDILENRILKAALRALIRLEQLPRHIIDQLGTALVPFSNVSDLRLGTPVPLPAATRLNSHYQPALRIARWVLDATSWAHTSGASTGATFLLNVAKVYEDFVGRVLQEAMRATGYEVELQVSDWRLDIGGKVRLRPDIVISSNEEVVAVADTKYKVWGATGGSPPNADIYQGLAYAITGGVPEAHLLYVSGDVEPQRYDIATAGVTVVAHAVDLSGHPQELLDAIRRLGDTLARSRTGARTHPPSVRELPA